MANKNYNYGRNSKKGIIAVIAAFTASILVLAAAAAVIGWGTNGYKDWSFKNFTHQTGQTTPNTPDAPIQADGELIKKIETCYLPETIVLDNAAGNYAVQRMSAEVAASERAAANSVVITLGLTSNVLSDVVLERLNISVSWSVEFVNPNSAWATGKNASDYVSVVPDSNFTRTATVTALAPFGEQIRLKAQIQAGNMKTASSTMEYISRASSAFTDFYGADFGDGMEIHASGTFEVGTTVGIFSFGQAIISINSDFVILVKSYLKFDVQFKNFVFDKDSSVVMTPGKGNAFSLTIYDGVYDTNDYSNFISNWDSLTTPQQTAVKFAWWNAYQKDGANNVEIELTVNYDDQNGKSLSQLYGIKQDYITGESEGDGISVDGSLVDIYF